MDAGAAPDPGPTGGDTTTTVGSTPNTVPGVIEAENFDQGGEGVAFHTAAADGAGGLPSQAVALVPSVDSLGGGTVISDVQAGDWFTYTINVTDNGRYDLAPRVSSVPGAELHFELDGADITGLVTVPSTGSTSTFEWVDITAVPLTAGNHVLKIMSDEQTFDLNSIRVSATPPSTPFLTNPSALPGTLQAEDFDAGGEGAGYHDKTPGNAGGLYRPNEDVDIIASPDSGGGYVVNSFQTGEWLAYTVAVAMSAQYAIDLRVSNGAGDAAYRVEVDGRDVTGSVTVPSTGGVNKFQWIGKSGIPLAAGTHLLKVVSNVQAFNLNSIRVTAAGSASETPYTGTPSAIPGTIQAENFDKGGEGIAYHDLVAGNAGGQYRTSEDVDIIASADSEGAGFEVNNFQTGEWLGYTVKVASSSQYDIDLRAATVQSGSAFHVEMDGRDVTGRVTVPNTGSWATFQWIGKKSVPLTVGTHIMRVVSDQQYFDVTAIRVQKPTAAVLPPPGTGKVVFSCTFATSPLECGFSEQSKAPGRATLASVGRDGATAARLRTQPGDTNVFGSDDAERDDLALSQAETDCFEGREQWWANSIYFPSDYTPPKSDGWGVVLDFHHTGSTGQANFHIDAMPNPIGLRLRGYGGPSVDSGEYEVTLGPVTKNVWYDFVFHVKWSSGSGGLMEAWVNGVKKLTHNGPTLYSGLGCYLKLANYHTPVGVPSSVIHDRIIRGTTAGAVSLTPLQGVP